MSDDAGVSFSLENRLNEVIAAYIQAVDAGGQPNQQEILTKHPDLAAHLRDFFADHDRMRTAAAPFQPANPADALTLAPGDAKPADGSLGKVRYFGDYELLEEISRGGMGVVYRARQVSLNRIVALKMILAGQLASPAEVQRFRREAESAASLDHPNIVPIFEVGEHQGQHHARTGLCAHRRVRQGRRRFCRGSPPRAGRFRGTQCPRLAFGHVS
jgi:serine/threonine-protein kinase